MANVNQMLQGKGRQVYTVGPQTTVLEALQLMADRDVGALVVVEGDDIAGIFSERDYARKIVLMGKSSRETPVSEIMTADVICVTPGQTADKCMAIMTDRHIRHLPVLEKGRVVGVLSIGDLVKAILGQQRETIEQLEAYIRS